MDEQVENPDSQVEEEIQTGHAIKAAAMRSEEVAQTSKEEAIARIYRQLGRIETGEFFKKFIDVTTLHFYQQVKEEKTYRKIPRLGTWKAFCKQVAGCSRQKVDQDLMNLKDLGPELYEMSDKLKLGYRDLSQLRKLPEGDRQQMIDDLRKQEIDKEKFLSMLGDAFEESFKARQEKAGIEELRELEKKEHEKKVNQLTIERNEYKKALGDRRDANACQERFQQAADHLNDAHDLLESIDFSIFEEEGHSDAKAKMAGLVAELEETARQLTERLYQNLGTERL